MTVTIVGAGNMGSALTKQLLPTVFVSHGAPSFALEPGVLGPRLAALGRALPRPRAILVVSPHWSTHTAQVTHTASPPTMYDFSGFDEALYTLRYAAPGAPDVADQIVQLLNESGWPATPNEQRGLDHGAWVPLRYIYPEADIPVIQVSIPHGLDPRTLKRLETVFTEADLVARGRYAFTAATLDFPVFYSARKQGHGANSFLKNWVGGSVVL